MVGLNYRLRGRESLPRKSKNKTDETEDDSDEVNDEPVMRSSAVRYNQDQGSYSSLVPQGRINVS